MDASEFKRLKPYLDGKLCTLTVSSRKANSDGILETILDDVTAIVHLSDPVFILSGDSMLSPMQIHRTKIKRIKVVERNDDSK